MEMEGEGTRAEVENRKKAMLKRLETRRLQSFPDKAVATLETTVDSLMARARRQLAAGVVEPAIHDQLQCYAASGCSSGREEMRVKEVLAELRGALLKEDKAANQQQPSSFSFHRNETKGVVTTKGAATAEKTTERTEETTDTLPSLPVSRNGLVVEGVEGEERVVRGEEGSSMEVSGCSFCSLSFPFHPSTVIVSAVTDSSLFFLPIQTSLFIRNCSRLRVYASAQQIRLDRVEDCRLHVSVSGAVVIESSSAIQVAPFRLCHNDSLVSAVEGEGWRNVKDFDWLAEEASPNWKIMGEEEWKTVSISSSTKE